MPKRRPNSSPTLEVCHEVLDRIKRIESFVKVGQHITEDFNKGVRDDAITYNLVVIAEVMHCIPRDVRLVYDEIPWDGMLALKDTLLAPIYQGDDQLLQNVIDEVLPDLKASFRRVTRLYEPRGTGSRRVRKDVTADVLHA